MGVSDALDVGARLVDFADDMLTSIREFGALPRIGRQWSQ